MPKKRAACRTVSFAASSGAVADEVLKRRRVFRSTEAVTSVAVTAILVASIRLNFLDVPLNSRCRGPNRLPCDASFGKRDEVGHFHQGSTIVLFGTLGLELWDGIEQGATIRMGQPLLRDRRAQSEQNAGTA